MNRRAWIVDIPPLTGLTVDERFRLVRELGSILNSEIHDDAHWVFEGADSSSSWVPLRSDPCLSGAILCAMENLLAGVALKVTLPSSVPTELLLFPPGHPGDLPEKEDRRLWVDARRTRRIEEASRIRRGIEVGILCGFAAVGAEPCANLKPCNQHRGMVCWKCGAPAVRQCHRYSSFGLLCGVDECAEHPHHAR